MKRSTSRRSNAESSKNKEDEKNVRIGKRFWWPERQSTHWNFPRIHTFLWCLGSKTQIHSTACHADSPFPCLAKWAEPSRQSQPSHHPVPRTHRTFPASDNSPTCRKGRCSRVFARRCGGRRRPVDPRGGLWRVWRQLGWGRGGRGWRAGVCERPYEPKTRFAKPERRVGAQWDLGWRTRIFKNASSQKQRLGAKRKLLIRCRYPSSFF